jgi:DMSO/TMAO reductase YedYZ molybdopterin-dependent catalytic subunit
MSEIHRRGFLARAAVLGSALQVRGGDTRDADSRIVLSKEPLNLEMPFASLKGVLTPTREHYVRSHYPVPKIDPRAFTLEVSGAVEKPLKLSLPDLRKMKTVTRAVTLECAGNGRSMLPEKVKGVQWGQGGVSTAEWTGVPLAEVLRLAGVKKAALEVILDAADRGDPKKEGQPAAPISFSRSLPIERATKGEALLAFEMNGKPLPPAHGFPLRAIVPGWYGCASVKWLTRALVVTEPFAGFDQTIDYSYWRKGSDGLFRLTPITEMEPKAQIAQPTAGSEVEAGKELRIFGAAWAGDAGVDRVDVSTDGGKSWRPATLQGMAVSHCWRLWEAAWTPRKPGKAVLMARATDGNGKAQPLIHDLANRRSYMINFIQPIPVLVK